MNNKTVSRDELVSMLEPAEGIIEQPLQMGTDKTEFFLANGEMHFRLNNKEYGLTENAFIKASRLCGMPETYVSKFGKAYIHLLFPHLNHFFKQKNDSYNVLVKDDFVVSFVKGNFYSRLKVLELIEDSVAPTSLEKDNLLYDKVHNSAKYGLSYGLVSNTKEFMKEGDLVRGGIRCEDHIFNEKPLVISAYVWRQICSNGMISTDIVSKWSRRGSLTNLEDWVKACAIDANKAVVGEFEKIKQLQDIEVKKHGADILNNIFVEFNVSGTYREAISNSLINEGEVITLYDIWNSITAAANSVDFMENPNIIKNLQMLASSLVEHSKVCPECHALRGK